MLQATEIRELLALAEASAGQAGRMLLANQHNWNSTEIEVGRDVKVTGDREAERIIANLLSSASGLAVFGEESGLMGDASSPLVWVVDPLDGTANYQRNLPLCCVSIALCDGDSPILGAIFDFNSNEMFGGINAPSVDVVEASLNGSTMRVSKVETTSKAVLATGFPVAANLDGDSLRHYVGAVQSFRKVRSLGSAALMLAYVAAGRMDAYWERSVRFWDVAAGVALVGAAGGRTLMRSEGDDFSRTLDLHAWNGVFDFGV